MSEYASALDLSIGSKPVISQLSICEKCPSVVLNGSSYQSIRGKNNHTQHGQYVAFRNVQCTKHRPLEEGGVDAISRDDLP